MYDVLERSKKDRNDFALWDTLKRVEGWPTKWNETIKNHVTGKELPPKNLYDTTTTTAREVSQKPFWYPTDIEKDIQRSLEKYKSKPQ